MPPAFDNRVALVAGGSRGIGRSVALQLARGGASVAVTYATRPEPAAEVVAEIEAAGGQALALACDVASQQQVDRTVAAVREKFGPIELLAHCGAISNTCSHQELTFERWSETIDVNLHGTFRILFAVKDEMLDRGFGRIVTIASVAALRPRQMQIHYATSKAAVIALTRCLAEALAPKVRVNCVSPGLTETEMVHVLPAAQIARIAAETPLGRVGQPDEIAKVVCFLLSEESSFMTGQTVSVCGGRVMLPG
jgi:3-oxoacyl-[acyl-carrier protein] reductase